jgi:hypothetical protein
MIATLALLAACDPEPTFKGTGPLNEYFPYDGERQALYYYAGTASTDSGGAGIGYNLLVDKLESVEEIDDVEVVTFTYTKVYLDDTTELLGQIKWMSDSDGVRVYAYAEGLDDFITFEHPIEVTSNTNYMHTGDSVETQTDGYTFTCTYVGQEDISVQWGLDWEGAVHFRIDDGDGDDMIGPFFAGDYWLVTRYGPAWMHLTGYEDKWDLADYDWSLED